MQGCLIDLVKTKILLIVGQFQNERVNKRSNGQFQNERFSQ